MQRIYLDHAASTTVEAEALQAALPFLTNNFANPSALHSEGRTAKAAIEYARKQIADINSCPSNELFFCASATEANNTVIKSAVGSLQIKTIICSGLEHPCVSNSIAFIQQQYPYLNVCMVESLETGQVNLQHLEQLLAQSPKPALVSIIHGHNELGFINDIYTIGKLCKQHQAIFHTDTVQTATKLDLYLNSQLIHFAVASAHKLGGIKGAGLLYANRKYPLKSYISGGGQERNFRAGTENVASISSFAKAWHIAELQKLDNLNKLSALKQTFVTHLAQILPSAQYNSLSDKLENTLPHILSLRLKTNIALSTLLFKLDLKGLSVSAGAACSAGAIVSSSTSRFLNLSEEYKTIRLSFSAHNSVEELIKAANIVFETVK